MRYNNELKDYVVIKTGNGEKLERWGNVTLLRPDPQVIWKTTEDRTPWQESTILSLQTHLSMNR